MIKAIIFDADGVVIQSERFSLQLERDYGITRETTLPFFQGIFADCRIGKADLKIEIAKYINDWGWKGTTEELLTYWFESGSKVDQKLLKYIQTLRQKGIKCFLGTNNEKYRVDHLTSKLSLDKAFDKVYASGHIGSKKPDLEFFKHIADDQKLDKSSTLVVDDDPEDLEGAKQFGFKTELYTSFEDFQNKLKTYLKRS